MKKLVHKFIEIEQKISNEKGNLSLFALFLREDSLDKWDLLIAAPWIEANRKTAFAYIAQQIQASLEPEELAQLSRIVLIDQANPALDAINNAVRIEHGVTEIQDSNFFGLQIKHALIITSQKSSADLVPSPAS
ncbi:MAG: hypothetical protein HC875_38295 [Anaerolineales bacterium]|nr:hypothetical protein [Anaerolineales bacterium]